MVTVRFAFVQSKAQVVLHSRKIAGVLRFPIERFASSMRYWKSTTREELNSLRASIAKTKPANFGRFRIGLDADGQTRDPERAGEACSFWITRLIFRCPSTSHPKPTQLPARRITERKDLHETTAATLWLRLLLRTVSTPTTKRLMAVMVA